MTNESRYNLSHKEKEYFISALVPELLTLRVKANISQEELANLIGVSRQTYGAIERGTQKLSWNTYLSLILFYDYNENTRDILHALNAFPSEIISRFNNGSFFYPSDFEALFGKDTLKILKCLDSKAFHAIKTVIMLEYARCTNTPGDAVVRSFNGNDFSVELLTNHARAQSALKKILLKDKSNE